MDDTVTRNYNTGLESTSSGPGILRIERKRWAAAPVEW